MRGKWLYIFKTELSDDDCFVTSSSDKVRFDCHTNSNICRKVEANSLLSTITDCVAPIRLIQTKSSPAQIVTLPLNLSRGKNRMFLKCVSPNFSKSACIDSSKVVTPRSAMPRFNQSAFHSSKRLNSSLLACEALPKNPTISLPTRSSA